MTGRFVTNISAIMLATAISACGGSGGGSGGDAGGEYATMYGFTITEDKTLDQNLSGVWIEESEIDFSAQFSEEYGGALNRGEQSFRQTIVIIDNGADDLYITDCDSEATNIENDSNTLEFDIGIAHYVLDKRSNTHMTGTMTYQDEDDIVQREGRGVVSMFKSGMGPESTDELADGFNVGLLRYSLAGGPERIMEVQCLASWNGTYGADDEDNEFSGIGLANLFGDYLEITTDEFGTSLYAGTDGYYAHLQADDDDEYINVTGSGTDDITIEIDASTDSYYFDASSDASSDAFDGTAHLRF